MLGAGRIHRDGSMDTHRICVHVTLSTVSICFVSLGALPECYASSEQDQKYHNFCQNLTVDEKNVEDRGEING